MVALSGFASGCIFKPVRHSTTFFFSPKVTLAFFVNELHMSFSTMPSLISPWYNLCNTLWTDGLKPF